MNENKRTVIDRRSVPVVMGTRTVIDSETVNATDKSLYAALCMYADNDTAECCPARETLWKKAGISDKTFRKSLRNLEEKGYIKVVPRHSNDGRRLSNLYVLLDVK